MATPEPTLPATEYHPPAEPAPVPRRADPQAGQRLTQVGPPPDRPPGPQPFPHQAAWVSDPAEVKRQQPWDEQKRRQDEQERQRAAERAQPPS
jgi:hypothetical protein